MSTWPPCAMAYDGSFAGFLTCVGQAFRAKEYPLYFLPPDKEQTALYPIREVAACQDLAKAVYAALEAQVSETFRRLVTYSFLTCLPQRERNMFDLIYLAFHRALPQDLTDDRVLPLIRAIRRLMNEAHQYQGFVRFADYGGLLVGQITPQNRVLPLLRPHFCQRLPGEAFLLHDKTHRQALFYAQGKWKIRPVDRLDLEAPGQAEAQCQQLWRTFFRTVAIPARENPRCQTSHLPKRFRGDMTEFQTPQTPVISP